MPEIRWIGKNEVLGAVRGGAVRFLRGVCGLSAGMPRRGIWGIMSRTRKSNERKEKTVDHS